MLEKHEEELSNDACPTVEQVECDIVSLPSPEDGAPPV